MKDLLDILETNNYPYRHQTYSLSQPCREDIIRIVQSILSIELNRIEESKLSHLGETIEKIKDEYQL